MAAPAETHGPPKPLVVFPVSAMAQVAAVVAASFSYLRHRPVPALLLAATGIPTQCRIPTVPLPVRPAWLLLPTSSPKLPARNPAPTALPPIFPSQTPALLPLSPPAALLRTLRRSPITARSMPSMQFSPRPSQPTPHSSKLSFRLLVGPATQFPSILLARSPAPILMSLHSLLPRSARLSRSLLLPPAARKSWMLPTSPPAPKTPTLPTTPPSL